MRDHRSRRTGRLLALAAAVLLCPLPAAVAAADAPAAHAATVVPAKHPWLDFVGRWERHYAGDEAATVNSGSVVRLRYAGRGLTGLFDVSTITVPPELWVTVDDGPQRLVTVNRPEIELVAADTRFGLHTVRIDVKDTDQVTNRWLPPLNDAVIVQGFRFDGGGALLPPPRQERLRMAFFGDSITEGIRALGEPLTPDGADGTRTYASLTAHALGADMQLVGFGKQGVMRVGVGNVPTAPESFGFNFQGSPADPNFNADIVVLLEGSNDSAQTDEEFAPAYLDYLKQARAANPHAWIFAMVPLIGRHAPVVQSDVASLADPRMVAVDTNGWLDRHSTVDYTDTVHPTVAGHLKVAEHLVPIISQVTTLPVRTSPARLTVPAITAAAGAPVDVTATLTVDQVLPDAGSAHGTVLVTAPPGFTVDRTSRPFAAWPGKPAAVQVHLRGTMPADGSSVTGQVRVLVDGQIEVLPTPLVVAPTA